MGNILARLIITKVDYVFEDSDNAIKKQRSLAGDFMPGKHDAELCTGGEADLHKHHKRCKKNPGHVNFIPVNDFNLDHLPSRYRDVIMLESIKAYSALTVMIKVRFTSLERPKSAKCFVGNYPFYKNKGKEYLRTGTGLIYDVATFTESDCMGPCPCGTCRQAGRQRKVWAEIRVLTATHVVFDNSEVRRTVCVVGFDDDLSPGVSLDGWNVGQANVKGDWCKFSCVSCDLEFVDKLGKMCRQFEDLREKVRDKFQRIDDVEQLTVIVSHPHGCPKQVSVGQCTDQGRNACHMSTKYMYTNCTCPGSSGAAVYLPGFDWRYNPHSGSSDEGNYSGEFC